MKKTIQYGIFMTKFVFKAMGYEAAVWMLARVYENTLYPFLSIYSLAKVLDVLTTTRSILDPIFLVIAGLYTAATLLRNILVSFLDTKEAYLLAKLDSYVDLEISKKLTELDPGTFENPSFQSLLAQIDGVKGAIQKHMIRVIELSSSIIKIIIAVIILIPVFPLFIPIIAVVSTPSFFIWERYRKKTWDFYVSKRSLMVRVAGYIKTLLSSDSTSKEAKIFHTGPELIRKVQTQQAIYYNKFNDAVNPRLDEIIFSRFLQFSGFIYTQYVAVVAVLSKKLAIGHFALVFQQTMNLAIGIEETLNQYSSIGMRNQFFDIFFEFMNTVPTIVTKDSPQEIPKNLTPPAITFRNVSFKYPGTDRYVFKKLNVTIQSGEKIAIVGENGAGKTTLIKLLLRFYDVTDGELLINDVNIKDLSLEEWHTYIGALFQDFIRYQFTFKENVFFGDLSKKHDQKQLIEAIAKSGADDYLPDLPKRYDQVLGKMFEGGIDLSGGQWQKLALARAFYRDAPILILDEPTSAIDAKAEYEIFQRVQELQKDKTVIIISHRFSTVRNADRILVIDEGRIVEEGNHEKLMKEKGVYAELFTLQAKGYQ